MFDFYYQLGTGRRKVFRVSGDYCSIGSARSNELVIHSRQMGKRQAELRYKSDGVYLKDLGSLSRCSVNKERVIEFGPLSELDEVDIGDLHLRLKRIGHVTAKSADAAVLAGVEYPAASSEFVEKTLTRTITDETEYANAQLSTNDPSGISEEQLIYWSRIVHEHLLQQMDLQRKDVNRMSDEQLRIETQVLIDNILDQFHMDFPAGLDRTLLLRRVLNESVGLGPLEELLADEAVSEIMVNSHRDIFVERNGKLEKTHVSFSSDASVSAVIDRIISPLGRRIDESSPIVDARLKDGSRVNAIVPPLSLQGPSLTIRKFVKQDMQFTDLVDSGSISEEMVDFLKVCVERRKNIVVSGGTGTGKTTLLNVLSNFIPSADRIITIEDAAELKLVQPNIVSLEARPANIDGRGAIPIRDLVKNSLRMRPDRIVIGECRGGEALDMLQAMNTGHDGSLTTVHANTPRDVLSRLEVLVLMAGMDLPVGAIREQIAAAVHIIVQLSRYPCGSRKISNITEVVGVESGTIQLQELFNFQQQSVTLDRGVKGQFRSTGAIPSFYEELSGLGYDVDLSGFQPRATRVSS